MSASAFLQWVTQALYLLISLVVLTAAIRRPSRARVDIAAFFAVITAIIVEGWLIGALDITPGPLLNALVGALLMTLPYLLVRLVNDFAAVPSLVLRGAELGLALSIVALFALAGRLPAGVGLLMALYFFGFNIYAAVAFWRAGRRASGVTCRRMQAIAAGSVCLGVVILAAGLGGVEPAGARPATALIGQIASLASGVAFFLGFAPPPLLRSAWQEPELRAFLGRAASLPRLPDTAAIVRELERGAAQSLGAPAASIGLWDEAAGTLTYSGPNGPVPYPADALIGGRAFVAQRAVFSADAARDDPAHADLYRATSANAVLAAPITAGGTRLGVLSVFAPRAPIFAEEDLELLQLLADQGAVILESRALIDEAARVRAREEATRLKDDFLSAAAHDLKTPLTALIATAQLLERRATRQPDRPADLGAIRRIVGEAIRLRTIVVELLDAARAEQGRLLGRREPTDLAELAREVGERHDSDHHTIVIDAPGAVVGDYDRLRIGQLLDNLVENAIKYSPAGGTVRVAVRASGNLAEVAVTDEGIGIPPDDLPHLFERFHRGANVDDRQFAGMGLGLYICRGIVEEHGGRIDVVSALGQGSTFRVTLPCHDAGVANPQGEGAREQVGTGQPV